MEFRVVEITDDTLAAVFEVYAATDIFPPALARLAAKGGQVGVAGLARAAGRMLRLAAEGG
jgi:hypothetical protein